MRNEKKQQIKQKITKKQKEKFRKETYAIEKDIDRIVQFGNLIFNALIKN